MLTEIVGGLTALGGLLGASAAQRRAEQARQQALTDLTLQNNTLYDNTIAGNGREIYGTAGAGVDAINALGANLGSANAGAGVYNSSAVSGALANETRDRQAALANLTARLQANATAQKSQGLMQIGQLRLGMANADYGRAQDNLDNARGGVGSFIGSLAQSNLARSGANATRMQLPAINGTQNQGAALQGMTFNLPSVGGTAPSAGLGAFPSYGVGYRPRASVPFSPGAFSVAGR